MGMGALSPPGAAFFPQNEQLACALGASHPRRLNGAGT